IAMRDSTNNGESNTSSSINRVCRFILISSLFLIFCLNCFAQVSPHIAKVDPPSWWAGHSINPVRMLLRGENLRPDLRIDAEDLKARRVKVNDAGTAVLVDIWIDPAAKPGPRHLQIKSGVGTAVASFEVLPALDRTGRFQGFSPADVLYLI